MAQSLLEITMGKTVAQIEAELVVAGFSQIQAQAMAKYLVAIPAP